MYHTDNKVENMEVPSMEPQRVPSTPSPKTKNGAPNYISNNEDNARPTQHRRSPRLNTSLDAEQPDVPGNAPHLHRIVALAATETVEIPQLTIQSNKYARG